MKTIVKMTVDDNDPVYGLDFIDCLVELERKGEVPEDWMPHVCTFMTVPLTDELYQAYFDAANEPEV